MVQVVLYQAPDGVITLDVHLGGETVWLTQKQMAALFDTERSVITKHLSNIFTTNELEEKSNVQKMHIAHSDKPMVKQGKPSTCWVKWALREISEPRMLLTA